MFHITQDSQAVVEGYDDDAAVARQHASIHHVPGAFGVRAPVDVDHHRPQAPFLMDIWEMDR